MTGSSLGAPGERRMPHHCALYSRNLMTKKRAAVCDSPRHGKAVRGNHQKASDSMAVLGRDNWTIELATTSS
jgi:hypothetical protein